MQIRRSLEKEAAELTALILAAKKHWGYSDAQINVWLPDLNISAATIAAHPTFIAEHVGQMIGFYSLVPSSPVWELDHLWVLPAFMKKGIGRALLTHAQQTARDGGAARISINADPNAEPFYLDCGAKRVGIVTAPIAGQPQRIRPQLVLAVASSSSD